MRKAKIAILTGAFLLPAMAASATDTVHCYIDNKTDSSIRFDEASFYSNLSRDYADGPSSGTIEAGGSAYLGEVKIKVGAGQIFNTEMPAAAGTAGAGASASAAAKQSVEVAYLCRGGWCDSKRTQ